MARVHHGSPSVGLATHRGPDVLLPVGGGGQGLLELGAHPVRDVAAPLLGLRQRGAVEGEVGQVAELPRLGQE